VQGSAYSRGFDDEAGRLGRSAASFADHGGASACAVDGDWSSSLVGADARTGRYHRGLSSQIASYFRRLPMHENIEREGTFDEIKICNLWSDDLSGVIVCHGATSLS
jgi:hypothetical protein